MRNATSSSSTAADVPPPARQRRRPHDWPHFTSLDNAPLVLTLREVCAIYRISESTGRKRCAAETFDPPPFERHPYRWRTADIVADLSRRRRRRRA